MRARMCVLSALRTHLPTPAQGLTHVTLPGPDRGVVMNTCEATRKGLVRTEMRVRARTHIHTHTHTHTHTRTYPPTHARTHVSTPTHTRKHTQTPTYTYTHRHTHMHVHTRAPTRTLTTTHAQQLIRARAHAHPPTHPPTHVRARMGVWARVGVLRARVRVRVERCRGLGWRGGWCVFGLVDKSATKVARVGVQG